MFKGFFRAALRDALRIYHRVPSQGTPNREEGKEEEARRRGIQNPPSFKFCVVNLNCTVCLSIPIHDPYVLFSCRADKQVKHTHTHRRSSHH